MGSRRCVVLGESGEGRLEALVDICGELTMSRAITLL